MKEIKRVVVIGGGAAGFFCAVNLARLQPQLKVTLLEKTGKLLSKVKVSGGGRCNVTHACFEKEEMVKFYPRGKFFLRKAFHQFFTNDIIEWFEKRGVKLKTESDNRMFPVTDNSQTIVNCLVGEAEKFGVEIITNCEVELIAYSADQFYLNVKNRADFQADFLVVAAGGFHKKEHFQFLDFSGHSIIPLVPSLFTFNMPGDQVRELMGVSVDYVKVKIEGSKLLSEGPLLITHWGMSGPAILKLSAWGARELHEKGYHFSIHINWLGAKKEASLKGDIDSFRNSSGSKKIYSSSPFGLPKRLWEFLIMKSGIINPDIRWADLTSKNQNQLIKTLLADIYQVKGKTTFKEEFVTAGGIDLKDVDANTMESKKVSNLFFAGEILDVDGITGGFNFQNAWTTGYISAKTIAERVKILQKSSE